MGADPPKNRDMQDAAIDLYHASLTGAFPCPGGLKDQPARVALAYRVLLTARATLERVGSGATFNIGGKTETRKPAPVGTKPWVDAVTSRTHEDGRPWTYWDGLRAHNEALAEDREKEWQAELGAWID